MKAKGTGVADAALVSPSMQSLFTHMGAHPFLTLLGVVSAAVFFFNWYMAVTEYDDTNPLVPDRFSPRWETWLLPAFALFIVSYVLLIWIVPLFRLLAFNDGSTFLWYYQFMHENYWTFWTVVVLVGLPAIFGAGQGSAKMK